MHVLIQKSIEKPVCFMKKSDKKRYVQQFFYSDGLLEVMETTT